MRKSHTLALCLITGIASLSSLEGFAHSSKEHCREYTGKVTVGGELVNSYGTACLQPDGSWKLKTAEIGHAPIVTKKVVKKKRPTIKVTNYHYVEPRHRRGYRQWRRYHRSYHHH